MESLPVESIETIPATALEAGTTVRHANADPYHDFSLANEELQLVQPLQALMADAEVAGFMDGGNVDGPWSPARLRRLGLGMLAFLAVLLPLICLPGWNMFAGYAPPHPSDTPKPQQFAGNVALVFQDRVRSVNGDLQAGNRWQAAYEKLRALFDDAEEMPDDLRIWVDSELLVTLASKEVSPDAYDVALPGRVFADLQQRIEALPETTAVPFRAASAYAAVLNTLPAAKESAAERDSVLLAILERIRNEHPSSMDKSRDLLFMEAERHIAALPPEYAAQDRRLDYHWRRASHAIERLYSLFGTRDVQVRAIDRRRWETIYKYFDFTLLTLDVNRLGRLKAIQLDGREYSRDDIKSILEQL